MRERPPCSPTRTSSRNGSPVDFFGQRLAERLFDDGYAADLVVDNNVLAHVPDAHDFVEEPGRLLKPEGIVTKESPQLLRLVEERQVDTIYHEHFAYFSLLSAERLFAAHGLVRFDVAELPTHGGSLRTYAAHADGQHRPGERVGEVRAQERARPSTSSRRTSASPKRLGARSASCSRSSWKRSTRGRASWDTARPRRALRS